MDITEFVKARLDMDEWIAQGAARTDDGRRGHWLPVHFGAGGFDACVDDHVARHDPARVLREVAAKRAVLAAYDEAVNGVEADLGVANALEGIIRHVGVAWNDHPDYRDEWKP
jgi:uncharacterized protein DUF6221